MINNKPFLTLILSLCLGGVILGISAATSFISIVRAQTTTAIPEESAIQQTIPSAPSKNVTTDVVDVAEARQNYAKFTNISTLCGQSDFFVEPHKRESLS